MTFTFVTLSGYAVLVYIIALGLFAVGSSIAKRTVASSRRKRLLKIPREVEVAVLEPPRIVVQPWLLARCDTDDDVAV
jgi:hypothetical protein